MAEYIEREAVRLAYERSLKNDTHKKEEASAIHLQEHRHMLHVLDKIPAADVVEVVRCKDCKRCDGFPEKDVEPNEVGICKINMMAVKPTGFCNYGKRREIVSGMETLSHEAKKLYAAIQARLREDGADNG